MLVPGAEAQQAACPLPLELVDDYEQALGSFWATVHEHTEEGAICMGACFVACA